MPFVTVRNDYIAVFAFFAICSLFFSRLSPFQRWKACLCHTYAHTCLRAHVYGLMHICENRGTLLCSIHLQLISVKWRFTNLWAFVPVLLCPVQPLQCIENASTELASKSFACPFRPFTHCSIWNIFAEFLFFRIICVHFVRTPARVSFFCRQRMEDNSFFMILYCKVFAREPFSSRS